ncbi:MAG TPA: radical SAM protein [Bryobacteraceae bacterium]|nr:radical SAM protein [Bryobacteraceae bacterium]
MPASKTRASVRLMSVNPGMADQIRSLIVETLLLDVESSDTDLLAPGLLDSLLLIELLTELERCFQVSFDWRSLEFDDLRSPAMLAALVARSSGDELKTHDPELPKIARTLHELPFPTKFAVEVTAHCNLACAMCHHSSMQRPKGKMSLELWKRCADQVAAVSPQTECWFSFCGEPLMEPDLLLRMLEYGKSAGLRSLNINTNGILLTPGLAGPILDSGVGLIVFGVDGFTPDTYGRIRICGDRDVLYRNIEYLLQERAARGKGPEIQVQFIEMHENMHELEPFKAYWLEHGATVKVRNKLSWGGKFDTPMSITPGERIACPWAMTMLHVFWDGRVPRCPGDTEGAEGAGNAWDEPLRVLWQRLGSYRDLHLKHEFDKLPARCHDCKDWMTGAAQRIHPPATLSAHPSDSHAVSGGLQ